MQLQNIRRGDVVLVAFPNSNLITAKIRPALIVQADNLRTGIPQVIVAMITSRMLRSGHPSRISILLDTPEGRRTGLLSDSVIMTDNLATVSIASIYSVIGSFPKLELDRAMRRTLGI